MLIDFAFIRRDVVVNSTRVTAARCVSGLDAGAVVGVAMFSNVAPDNFGVFDAAFLTLFYVTGGDPWPDALPKFNEDGSANWIVAAYIMAYTMIEIWVILQVAALQTASEDTVSRRREMP